MQILHFWNLKKNVTPKRNTDQILISLISCSRVLGCFNHVQLFVTPWSIAHYAPLLMEFSRQEYCSGLPCCPPGDLPDPEIKPTSLTSPALAEEFSTISAIWEAPHLLWKVLTSLEYDTLLRWLRQENLQAESLSHSFNSRSREEPLQFTFYLLNSAWFLSYGRIREWVTGPANWLQ